MRFPSSVRFETQSLEDAFNEAIKGPLTTDIIQRNYVWPKNQIKSDRIGPFIDDFFDQAQDVCSSTSNSVGQVVFLENKKDGTFAVLDGLQRMTTLYSFMFCIMSATMFKKSYFTPDDWRELKYELIPQFRILINKFKLRKLPQTFITENKSALNEARNLINGNTKFIKWFSENNKTKFVNSTRNLIAAILKSKISYCCVDDRDTAYRFFELLNSGAPLDSYEFLKVKISGCPGYTKSVISELNKLFVSADKDGTPEANEELIQCCLYATGKPLFKGDEIKIPTNLKDTIQRTTFQEYTLDMKNWVPGKTSFLTHCQAVKKHVDDIDDYFTTAYGIDDLFASFTVKKFMSLSFKDPNYTATISDYYKLFLLVEVLQQIPKSGQIFSGSLWNEGLSVLRRELATNNKNYSISLVKDQLRLMYKKHLRGCLINEAGIPRAEFLDQKYGNSQTKKLKKLFLLIETALNNNRLPTPGIYELDHIDAVNQENKVGNLVLLEKEINNNLRDDPWTTKYVGKPAKNCGYANSLLQLPKMIFGHFPQDLLSQSTLSYLQQDTVNDLTNMVKAGPITNPKNRVAGTEQHLAPLLDFTVQRMLEGI